MIESGRTARTASRWLVKHWMLPNPRTVSASEAAGAAFERMREFGFDHLPVLKDGKLVGMLSALESERVAQNPGIPVAELMRAAPLMVLETDTLEEAAHLLVRCGIGALPVVRPDGRLVGVISSADLLCAAFGVPRRDEVELN